MSALTIAGLPARRALGSLGDADATDSHHVLLGGAYRNWGILLRDSERLKEAETTQDIPLFVESIPFDETRGYVKSVRRNLSLYRVLYGDE